MFNRLYTEGHDEIVPLTTSPPVGFFIEDEGKLIDLTHPAWPDTTAYFLEDIVVTCDECGRNLLGRQVCYRDWVGEGLLASLTQTCDYCVTDRLPQIFVINWLRQMDGIYTDSVLWSLKQDSALSWGRS